MRRAFVISLLLLATGLALAADPLDPATAPTSVRRAVFRAERAMQDGDLEAACRILAEAVDDGGDRDHPAVRFRLGIYLLELDRAAEALPHLRVASEQAPGAAPVWRELGRAAYENGAMAEAAAAFATAYERQVAEHEHHGPDTELLYYSGITWVLADRPREALDVLAPLIASSPDTVPYEWTQALVSAAAAAEQPARAEPGVERLLREHPDRPDAWRLAAQLAQIEDDLPLAAVREQVAAWLDEPSAAEQRRLAELQAAAGAPRAAARIYARLWDGGRGDGSLAEPLAVTWLQAHEPDSARVVLTTMAADAPAARTFMLLGDLEYGVDRWDAAAAAYGRAAALEPDNGRAWLMQAASEVRAERFEEALAHLERAAADPAVAGEARRLLGQLERRSE